MQGISTRLEGYSRVLEHVLTCPSHAISFREDEHKAIDGYALGTPEGRVRLELDDKIEDLISSLPAATRLYPEVYAWKITEEVKKHYERASND